MQKKTPREVLGWLLKGRTEVQHESGEPNLYKLERLILKTLGRTVSQSTLHRLWTGESEQMSTQTVEILAAFFGVPESVIRGELTTPGVESFGMDITLAEIQMLHRLRSLAPEHRQLVDAQVKALEPVTPEGQPSPPAHPTPQGKNGSDTRHRRR